MASTPQSPVQVGEGPTSAGETIGRCIDEIRLQGAECTESVWSEVRARPLTALLAAIAVGLLVGRLRR